MYSLKKSFAAFFRFFSLLINTREKSDKSETLGNTLAVNFYHSLFLAFI